MTTLQFVLSPQNTQRVYEALICLSKFSEFVSLEARRNQLCFSSLNSTKSSYGLMKLSADRFFTDYTFAAAPSSSQDEDGGRFSCRLQAKALLAVFRQRYLDSKDKDTAIERCEVKLSEQGAECRILVRLACRHGVVKTYKLTYEETDALHALFDAQLAVNRWRINSTLLKLYMEHFGPKAEQLDFSTANGRAAFTSFTERLIDGKEILKQPLQTSVALDTSDFEDFEVEEGLHIAISLKDFKAITVHADSMNLTVEARYSKPGRPMQLTYGIEGMEAGFTLMTIADTRAMQNFAQGGTSRSVVKREPSRALSSRAPSVSQQPQPTVREASQHQELSPPAIPPLNEDEDLYEMPAPRASLGSMPPPPSARTTSTGPPRQPTPFQQPSQHLPSEHLPSQHSPSQKLPLQPRPATQQAPAPSSPPLPPVQAPAGAEARLFLSYASSDEDSCDLSRDLDDADDEMALDWDSGEPTGNKQETKKDVKEERKDEGLEDDGIGPTQQSHVVVGLFD